MHSAEKRVTRYESGQMLLRRLQEASGSQYSSAEGYIGSDVWAQGGGIADQQVEDDNSKRKSVGYKFKAFTRRTQQRVLEATGTKTFTIHCAS